jgi:alkylhydroperoxidase family enzyme
MNNGYTLKDPSNVTGVTKEVFELASERFGGRVPNIVNAFSESPVLANSMIELYSKIGETGFTPTESHVVMQTANVLNQCQYCVPAHSTGARAGGVDAGLDESLRNSQPLDDPKLEALRLFTTSVVVNRGNLSSSEFNSFIDSGWSRKQALDVIFLVTVKTLTNYGNHLTGPDLDDVFESHEWNPVSAASV